MFIPSMMLARISAMFACGSFCFLAEFANKSAIAGSKIGMPLKMNESPEQTKEITDAEFGP